MAQRQIKKVVRDVIKLNNPENYPVPLFEDDHVLLIAHIPHEPLPKQATTKAGKIELLRDTPARTRFTVFWPGKYTSSARTFATKKVRMKLLAELKD